MLRSLLMCFLFLPLIAWADVEECHIHKTHSINFRDYKTKDVLEIAVGPGPCDTAVMSLLIRSVHGDVFYSYNARFAPHVTADALDPNFDKFIQPFLDNLITESAKKGRDMPKYNKLDARNGFIKLHVGKKQYEQLRSQHVPLFFHPNSYNGWQYIIYDRKTGRGKRIASGLSDGM